MASHTDESGDNLLSKEQEDEVEIKDIFQTKSENDTFYCPWNRFERPGVLAVAKWKASSNYSNIPMNFKIWFDKEKLDKILPILPVESDKLKNPPDSKIQVTWIGHATVLVQFDGISILSDPVFSDGAQPYMGLFGYKRYRKAACKVEDIPKLDAVIISNNHYDHLDTTSVKDINGSFPNVKWFVALGTKQWLAKKGVNEENITELAWWKENDNAIKGFRFICTPAQHWCQRGIIDLNQCLWCSWVIKGQNNSNSYYFAGDTGYNEDLFKMIGKKYGPFNIAAIPIGAYEPRLIMKYQHVDPNEAVKIHKDVGSKQSVGIHWGTFNLTNEFYIEPPFKLAEIMKGETPDEHGNLPFTSLCHGETWVVGEETVTRPFMDKQHHPTSDNATSQQAGGNSRLDEAEEMKENTHFQVTEKTVDKTESVENATRAYEIYRGAFKTEMRDVKETDRPKTIKQTKDTEATNVLKTSESSTEKISEDNVKTEVSVKEQSATNETETKAFRPKQPYKLTEAMANSQSGGAVLQPAHTLSHGESEVNVVDNQMSTSLPLNNKSLFQSEVGTEMPKRETSTTIQRNEINSESSVVVTYYDEQSDRIQLDINRDRRQNMLGDISSQENIDEIPTQFRAAEVLVHADEEHMLKKPDQTPLASCQEKHTTTPSEQPKKFTGRSKPLNTNVMPQKLYSQENVDEIPTQFRPAEVLVHADEEQMLKKPDQTPLASCQEKHTTTPSEQPKKFTGRSKPLNTNVKHQKFTGRFKPQLHNEDRHKMPSAERLPISQQHSELPGREHVMESQKNTGYSRKK